MFGFFKKKTRAIKNGQVRRALASYGDDGTRARHVIHFAYPKRGATGLEDEAKSFIVGLLTPDVLEVGANDTGLRFEQTREVASADFDALTDALEAGLAEIGWEYDGWECAVETGEDL